MENFVYLVRVDVEAADAKKAYAILTAFLEQDDQPDELVWEVNAVTNE